MSPRTRKIEITTQGPWLRKAWADPGITVAMIESRLGVSDSVVHRWARELELGPKAGQRTEWAREREDLLRAYRCQKLTCRQIAQRFYADHRLDISQNTIRLKLQRMGLVPHVRSRKAIAAAQTHIRVRPGQGFIALTPLGQPDQVGATARAVESAKIHARLRAEAAAAPAPSVRGTRTLETLGEGECRFPLGDPKNPHFTYCGRRTAPRRDYCPGHDKRARPKPADVKKIDDRLGITAALRGDA